MDTQPIEGSAEDSNFVAGKVKLTFNPLKPADGKVYHVVSLPFSQVYTGGDAPNITACGTLVDNKGDTWFCFETDRLWTPRDASEPQVVVYKLYNKTSSDAARDKWASDKLLWGFPRK